jgi:dTDP-4-dehydrorhamnose 3,5-epimerase
MFSVSQCPIPGCLEIQPSLIDDERGRFVKVFHAACFADLGLNADFREDYYSRSRKGVIRGMHFQKPPADHDKLVYCTEGSVFDVVLDLRAGSPSYGQVAHFTLSADRANLLYIPKGLAHGFCATSAQATLIYKVSTEYSPKNDVGILWSSLPVVWPTTHPIVSARDQAFKPLSEFVSPFVYG